MYTYVYVHVYVSLPTIPYGGGREHETRDHDRHRVRGRRWTACVTRKEKSLRVSDAQWMGMTGVGPQLIGFW